MIIVQNAENIKRPKLKVFPLKPLEGNLNSTLSKNPNNSVYLEGIGSYLSSKFETVGGELMNKDMEIVFNHDMTMKPEFEHLKDFKLFKYHFYHELDNEEWT